MARYRIEATVKGGRCRTTSRSFAHPQDAVDWAKRRAKHCNAVLYEIYDRVTHRGEMMMLRHEVSPTGKLR